MDRPREPGAREEEAPLTSRQIMTPDEVRRAILRMGHEVVEKHRGTEGLALVGIQRRGVPLASRIADAIGRTEGTRPPVGGLDITFYRDDRSTLDRSPVLKGEDLPFDLERTAVVIVDDVLYTGRTVRAAMDALMARGRPPVIRLAVLVDRGHRELPIRADHVGKNVPTSREELVRVQLTEVDGVDGVLLERPGVRAEEAVPLASREQ
jgi:pyrimidine operon attenuation protein/uracil phosphoribosyltransferase